MASAVLAPKTISRYGKCVWVCVCVCVGVWVWAWVRVCGCGRGCVYVCVSVCVRASCARVLARPYVCGFGE